MDWTYCGRHKPDFTVFVRFCDWVLCLFLNSNRSAETLVLNVSNCLRLLLTSIRLFSQNTSVVLQDKTETYFCSLMYHTFQFCERQFSLTIFQQQVQGSTLN